VKNHAHSLFEKMGVHSRVEAVEQYRRVAFVGSPPH
jgi:DNA-binding NarL/FixJ family response regulator